MSKKVKNLFWGAPKQSWIALIFLWFVFAMNANGREIINRLLPYITDEYELSATVAGYLGSIAYLGLALASIPLARWADNKGHGWKRRNVCLLFAIGYLGFTALCGCSFITVSFGALIILQFFRGTFAGAGDPCEIASVIEWFPQERAGMALGIHHTSYPWGTAIGGLLITAFLLNFGDENWQYAFFIFPVIGVLIWVFYYKWSNEKNYKAFETTTREAGMTCPLEFDADDDVKPEPGAFGRCIRNPNISLAAVAALLCHLAYIGFNFWLPYYLAFVAGFNYAAAASLSLVYTITGGLGQIVWGIVADKIGTKRVLLICSLWLAIAFALMKFVGISLITLVACQLFLGCCSNGVYPVMYNYVAKSTEKGAVATANGILNTGLYVGACIATPIMGKCIDLGGGFEAISGYNTGLVVMCGCMIVTFLIFLLFTRETNGPRVGKDFAIVSAEKCNVLKNIK